MNNKLHLAPKYDRIFVGGRYLFLKLEENCELRGTDYVQGRISEHIFAPNGGYRTYYPSNLFHNERGLNTGEYSRIIPSFTEKYSITCASENI